MIEKVEHWGPGAPRRRSKSAIDTALRLNKTPWICEGCATAIPVAVQSRVYCKKCDSIQQAHRARIFSLSLDDWLDPEVPIEWLADMLKIICFCNNLDWLQCTKRPELFFSRLEAAQDWHFDHGSRNVAGWISDWRKGFPPPNVWILVSTENQEQLEKRTPHLLKIPAVIHALSCEPLLGPLDLNALKFENDTCDQCGEQITNSCLRQTAHCACCVEGDEAIAWPSIDWVIAGGESGPNARPCSIGWLRDIQHQCQAAGVAYFCKQLGSHSINEKWPRCEREFSNFGRVENLTFKDRKGANPSEWPEDMRVRQWPTTERNLQSTTP